MLVLVGGGDVAVGGILARIRPLRDLGVPAFHELDGMAHDHYSMAIAEA